MMGSRLCGLLLLGAAQCLAADPPAGAAISSSAASARPTLRVFAYRGLGDALQRWSSGFRQAHPEIDVSVRLCRSDEAMASLYTGAADIALLGREATASENKAFEWIYRHPPTQQPIASGSVDRAGASPALAVYVHRDNPLRGISLTQLDALFGAEHLSGAPANIRRWGQLGLEGPWRDAPVRLYMFDLESGTGQFLQQVILHGSRKLNWDALTEIYESGNHAGAEQHDAGRRIIARLAADRYGLAISTVGIANPSVRMIELQTGEPPRTAPATAAAMARSEYPLARTAYAYFETGPGWAQSFAAYLRSPAGQAELGRDHDYLPLSREQTSQSSH
jgi:phosphate transport system substrate-binding protein